MSDVQANGNSVLKRVQFALRKLSQQHSMDQISSSIKLSSSLPLLTIVEGEFPDQIGNGLLPSEDTSRRNSDDDPNLYRRSSSYAGRRRKRKSSESSGYSGVSDKEKLTWASSDEAKRTLLSALSGLYAMLLIILSLAFEISIIVVESVNASKYDLFYIYLYGLGLAFFCYCYGYLLKTTTWKETFISCCCWLRIFTGKKTKPDDYEVAASLYLQNRRLRRSLSETRMVTHSAPSAGSLYLRMGCVSKVYVMQKFEAVIACVLVFGVVGLIAKGLQLYSMIDQAMNHGCVLITSIMETILVMVFLFVQMFFIFQNNKLVIHRLKSLGRIGLMHLIATNLCTWIRSIVQEQYEVIEVIRGGIHHAASTITHLTPSPISDQHDHSSNISDHLADQQSITLNSANHLVKHGSIHHANLTGCFQNAKHRGVVDSMITEVKPFMITCIIEYSLICSAVMYILWRNVGGTLHERQRSRKQRFHVDCSSSTRGLFMGLLFMVFTIVSMVIFFTKMRSEDNYQALWVFYASDSLLYFVSILALVVGMLRIRNLYYAPDQKNTVLLDDILLIVGLVGQLMFCVFSVVPLNSGSLTASMVVVTSLIRMVEVLLQTIFIFFGQRLAMMTTRITAKNPGREMVTFLLMTNLSMFLINTFETQKAGSNPLMSEFYGASIWTVIVYSTVPLSIFYRFHSTVCLAEIWKHAYRVKASAADHVLI